MLIQSVLFFILGIASTTLVLILIGPTLWRRAIYLARQSLASEVPISLSEVQADRDFLRARHAFEIVRSQEKYEWLMENYNTQKLELDRAKEHLHRLKQVEKRAETLEENLVQTRSDLDIERRLLKALESNNSRDMEELHDLFFKEAPVSVDVATQEAELKKVQNEIIDIKQQAAKAALKLVEKTKLLDLGRDTIDKFRNEMRDITALFTAQTAIDEGQNSPIYDHVKDEKEGKSLAAKINQKTATLQEKQQIKTQSSPKTKSPQKKQQKITTKKTTS